MKFLLILIFTFTYIFASSAFITPEELEKEMKKNSNLILLDTTNEKTFKKGHITGATHADISDFRHQVKTYQLMRKSKEIEKVAQKLGINNNSEVIIYAHNAPKELLSASYIALALITNGLTNISILNGRYSDWIDEYEELISTKTKTPKKGNFTAKYNPNILVDLDYVKHNIGKVSMIEARPLRYFNAEAKSQGVKRLGHITKAQSSAWSNKFDTDNSIKTDEELNKIYQKNNLNPKEEVITYCTGGLEASMNWYILKEHLHFKNVKLYDASMMEWGNRNDTPMEK